MTIKPLLRLAAFLVLIPLLPSQAQTPNKVMHGHVVKVNGARMLPCSSDACATRGELSITLPAGAIYVSTHYFTSADSPNDRGDVYETGVKEVAAGRFTEAVHGLNNHGQEVVTVYYYNRAGHPRWVSINVEYQ